MTTSVIYDNAIRGLNMARGASNLVGGVSLSTIYGNLSTLFTTGVTQVQSVNNSASTTNPTATFTNTPTNGNAMIAIVIRGSDNVATTGPSGWTQIDAAGSAGVRRLEFWWKRAGASEAKTHTWTNATAALWEVTLLEFGGWATKADPVAISTCANVATTTSHTFSDIGVLCGIQAIVTSGGSAGTFTDTGTNCESVTNVAVTTTTRFRQFIADAWTNREDQTIQSSWTTSRPFTRGSVGWPNGDSVATGSLGLAVGNDTTAVGTSAAFAGQIGFTYDTSSIPTVNTVTSVTATYTAASGGSGQWPSTATMNLYSLGGASISASNANGPAVWKTPTQLSALTRCATRAAGSAWAASTAYNWTSDAAFTGQIVKGGTTSLLLATSDQAAGTTRASDQYALFTGTSGTSYLTIVHNYQASVSVPPSGTYSLTLVPAVTRSYGAKRTTSASLTANPTIARTLATARAVATSLNVTPTITRLAGFVRTIASTLTGAPSIIANIGVARSASATLTTVPTVNRVASFARSVTNTVGLIGGVAATVVPIIAALTHRVSLRVRHTVTLAVPDRIRLTVRSKLRLPEE